MRDRHQPSISADALFRVGAGLICLAGVIVAVTACFAVSSVLITAVPL